MARPFNSTPSYLLHSRSGKARVVVYDHTGARKEILLPGLFESAESRQEYDRLCATLRTHGGRLPAPAVAPSDLTVAELVLRYMEHASTYYVNPDTNKPTSEMQCLRDAFRPLVRLFGHLSVGEFTAPALVSLQNTLAEGSWLNDQERERKEKQNRPLGMARTTVNLHTDRVRRLFRWGCSREFVPEVILTRVASVPGLRQGRGRVRETKEVAPVPVELVEATLPLLPPAPADIIRVLLLTGARVGEVGRMRGVELDCTGPIWQFRPRQHKGRHRGQPRVIAVGPRAQLVLRKYLKDDPDAFLFSPAEEDARRKAGMRANRKSKVQPSQVCRARRNPKRKPGERYNHNVLNNAIRRACERGGLERWHVHQLRHAAALQVVREHGLEAARSTLGHKKIDMTTHYAGIDLERAKEVAAKIG